MKALIQTGSSLSACGHAQAGGRVPVPLKSDFLSIIDEFGGGAMVIKREQETVWVDALGRAKAIAAGAGKELPAALAVLRKLEDVISGIEAEADNAGIDLEEARHWWKEAAAVLARAGADHSATQPGSMNDD
jgi:hypothetical protein